HPSDVVPALVAGTHSSARSTRAWQRTVQTTSFCARCLMDRGDKPRDDRCGSRAEFKPKPYRAPAAIDLSKLLISALRLHQRHVPLLAFSRRRHSEAHIGRNRLLHFLALLLTDCRERELTCFRRPLCCQ